MFQLIQKVLEEFKDDTEALLAIEQTVIECIKEMSASLGKKVD